MSVDGHNCTYSKLVPEDEINDEVMDLLKVVMESSRFEERLSAATGADGKTDDLRKEIERLKEVKRKAETKKSKILSQLAALDPDTAVYDSISADLMKIITDCTEEIRKAEDQMDMDYGFLDDAAGAQMTVDKLKSHYRYILKHMDTLNMEQQKRLVQDMVKEVTINEAPVNGRWLKEVRFAIDLDYDPSDIKDAEEEAKKPDSADVESVSDAVHDASQKGGGITCP